jgi:hypothetical protein
MSIMNATYLFEGRSLQTTHLKLPHKSESFWTAIFSLFLLDLGKVGSIKGHPRVWQCKEATTQPWYELRRGSPILKLTGLEFDDLVMEPPTLAGHWFDEKVEVPARIGGVRPDVLLRLRSNSPNKMSHYVLIENKTVGADLNKNQVETYPKLLSFLSDHSIECQFILLMSVGVTEKIYKSAKILQQNLGSKFGLLLWEDIFRQMKEHQFQLPGIEIDSWQKYTEALDDQVG